MSQIPQKNHITRTSPLLQMVDFQITLHCQFSKIDLIVENANFGQISHEKFEKITL